MIINALQKRYNLALIKRVDETKNFDTKSFHHHMIAGVVLKEHMKILRFSKYLKYLFVVKVFIVSKPLNS